MKEDVITRSLMTSAQSGSVVDGAGLADAESTVMELGEDHVIVETSTDRQKEHADEGHARILQSTSQASPARGSGTFTITFKYLTPMTTQQQASFEYAAQRLGRIITTRHTPFNISPDRRCPMVSSEPLPSTLGDLFIFVRIKDIDGLNNVLGQAGPCILINGFPRVGYVEFDRADVQQMITDRTFDAVCVHEIAHILGFGTLWEEKRLIGGSSSDPRYVGSNGVAALRTIQGEFLNRPPVQDRGGAGTALSHWRDSTFGDEMMTAYLSAQYQPMSALSVQALRDLGYGVDGTAADTFVVSRDGYPVADSPYKPEAPDRTPWLNLENATGLSSTTIWIVACVVAAVFVFGASFIYSRVKSRRNRPVRQPTSAMSSAPRPQPGYPPPSTPPVATVPAGPTQGYIPTAQAVVTQPTQYAYPAVPVATHVLNDRDINNFMEVTHCRDRHVAISYLQEASGSVPVAIDRYLENPSRSLTIT